MSTSCCSESRCGPSSNLGMGGAARRIWSSVIWKTVVWSKPPPALLRAAKNALSRFGPTVPAVAASWSVWQLPQFLTKSCFPRFVSALFKSTVRPAQPASRKAAARSARQRKRPGNDLRRLRSLAQALESLVARLVHVEDLVQTGDLEDLRDVAVAADEREPPPVRPQALHAADEHAEGRRVDEGRVGEIDYDLLHALADRIEKLLLELRRGVEIHLARECDHACRIVDPLGLDVEVHVSPCPLAARTLAALLGR